MSGSIFGKIIDGEIPAEKLYEDEHCIVINDINPAAPVHLLVIPKKAIAKLSDAEAEDQALLGHLMLVAGKLAREQGTGEGFRLIVNNGADAGQTVFHLHLHVIGGRSFAESGMVG
jgi:histidine triad (HIT) family protein